MEPIKFFAKRLKELLAEKGITQYSLAKLSGVSKQAINNIIVNDKEPTWETVQRIAAALEVDCTEFKDPSIVAAAPETLQGRGRPRKDMEDATPAPEPKKATKKRRGK